MKRLLQFFEDGEGALSSTRLGFLAWTLGALGVWCYVSVESKSMAPIPDGLAWFLLVIGGIKGLESIPAIKPATQSTQ
jgi:hypothetical protein